MKDSMLRRALLGFGLLITLLWLQGTAGAQSLELLRAAAKPLANCPECDASASNRSTLPVETGGDALLRKDKKHTLVELTVTTADRPNGITGFVENKTTGAKISFQSKRDGEQLVTRIRDKEGNTLIEYIESQQEIVNPAPGVPPVFEWVPWLRVNGIEYKGYEGEILDQMKAVVSNEAGELIRQLAIYVVLHASGEDLEPERRGLEIPYQALQRFYETSFRKTGVGIERSIGSGDLLSKAKPERRKHDDGFTLAPNGCEMPDCKFVETHDYQLTEQGGFVVKSLSPRLTLSHNFASRAEVPHSDDGGITLMDDGSQVGDCFGRCGAGCGDWTHDWIDRTEYDETYCQEVQFPPDLPIDCSWMCCVEERRLVGSSGIAVHTAHGKVTPGAIAHDWCCRNLWLGCWNPVCIALLPGAADCLIPGVGWDETWSYVGPHSDAYTYSTGNCCYQQ
ncbi:MAG TPA: hypothetical protein VFV34_03200 [Blastocatellia bacterium]|nr:hypothetical protein [Blastocatellia bacterium]